MNKKILYQTIHGWMAWPKNILINKNWNSPFCQFYIFFPILLLFNSIFHWLLFAKVWLVLISIYLELMTNVHCPEYIKGAMKSYLMLYLCVVIIFFNTDLCKSAFSTYSFEKQAFRLSMLFFFVCSVFKVDVMWSSKTFSTFLCN